MAEQNHIQAVIFDLGGVILRTDDPRPRMELAQSLGMTRAELEDAVFSNPVSQRAERGLATQQEVWAAVAKSLNLPEETMPAFSKQFFGGDRVDFALIELIQQFRAHHTTALLSNTWIVDLPGFLRDNLQIPDTFDIIISSAQRRMAKPDPEIFDLTLELTGARPEEAVFVDDASRNIAAAASLGIHTVHFRSTEQARGELLALLKIAE